MKLLFRQSCSCHLTPEDLPKPSFRITQDFDTDVTPLEIHASAEMTCAKCGLAWESIAGLKYAPKEKTRIITR